MSSIAWTIAILAQGAVLTLNAQISKSERVGFECSSKGISFLVQLETANHTSDGVQELELVLNDVRIKPTVVYKLETKPPYWAGDLSDTNKVFRLLSASGKMKVLIPNRVFEIDLNSVKSTEFVNACKKLKIENL